MHRFQPTKGLRRSLPGALRREPEERDILARPVAVL